MTWLDGELVKDSKIIANSFNLFFSLPVQNSARVSAQDSIDKNFFRNSILNQTLGINKKPALTHFKLTSTNEIIELIKSLKTKDSCGYDDISSRILKISAPCIASPLTYIFNKILILGVFPDRMKYSVIKPLHKKGSTKELGNYRPISLFTAFSKVLEKLIYKRLYSYLDKNRILSKDQFGFRKTLSTSSATDVLMNSILSAFDNKKYVGGLFCDIRKAFDTVNHELLLTKLESYGILGSSYKLLKSYLKDRYQKVVIINNSNTEASSSWELVRYSVPQGSVLVRYCFLFTSMIWPISYVDMLSQYFLLMTQM